VFELQKFRSAQDEVHKTSEVAHQHHRSSKPLAKPKGLKTLGSSWSWQNYQQLNTDVVTESVKKL